MLVKIPDSLKTKPHIRRRLSLGMALTVSPVITIVVIIIFSDLLY